MKLMALCLFLSAVFVLQVTSASTTARPTGDAGTTRTTRNTGPTGTTNSTVQTPYETGPTNTSLKVEISTPVSERPERGSSLSTAHPKQGPPTQHKPRPQTPKSSSANMVVPLLLITLALIILLVLLFRWYSRNPEQRSLRGLRNSMVENARRVCSTAVGHLQHQSKPAEEAGEDEEVMEMEGEARGEKPEGGPPGGGDRRDRDPDSDDSSEDGSTRDAPNLTEAETQEAEDENSTEEDGGDMEDMTSIKLEEEGRAGPEEVDDLTPL